MSKNSINDATPVEWDQVFKSTAPRVDLDSEWFSGAVAKDLLWHAENAERGKLRKACMEVAAYYMTFDQLAQYLGSTELAEEYFR